MQELGLVQELGWVQELRLGECKRPAGHIPGQSFPLRFARPLLQQRVDAETFEIFYETKTITAHLSDVTTSFEFFENFWAGRLGGQVSS